MMMVGVGSPGGGSLGTLTFVVSINWSCSCKCVVGGGGHCRERGEVEVGSGGLLSSTVASWRLTCEAGVVMDSV